MLIEQYIKHVERYFWDRKQIQKVVDEEKEQRICCLYNFSN